MVCAFVAQQDTALIQQMTAHGECCAPSERGRMHALGAMQCRNRLRASRRTGLWQPEFAARVVDVATGKLFSGRLGGLAALLVKSHLGEFQQARLLQQYVEMIMSELQRLATSAAAALLQPIIKAIQFAGRACAVRGGALCLCLCVCNVGSMLTVGSAQCPASLPQRISLVAGSDPVFEQVGGHQAGWHPQQAGGLRVLHGIRFQDCSGAGTAQGGARHAGGRFETEYCGPSGAAQLAQARGTDCRSGRRPAAPRGRGAQLER
jgi:hypothetical protein